MSFSLLENCTSIRLRAQAQEATSVNSSQYFFSIKNQQIFQTLWALCSLLSYNYLILPLQHKSSHRQYINKGLYMCSNKTLLMKTGSMPDWAPSRRQPIPGLSWSTENTLLSLQTCQTKNRGLGRCFEKKLSSLLQRRVSEAHLHQTDTQLIKRQTCQLQTSGDDRLTPEEGVGIMQPDNEGLRQPELLDQSARTNVGKTCHRRGHLSNGNLSFTIPGSKYPRSRCRQGQCLLRPLSLACKWSSFPRVFTWLSLCARLRPNFLFL